MTISQLLSLLFLVIAYAAFVGCQFTVWERRLHKLEWREAIIRRLGWSILHFFVGYFAVAGVGSYVNICATGNYRHGPFDSLLYPISAGVIGLFIPWLALLWNKRGEGK